jgi:hypothetical protein
MQHQFTALLKAFGTPRQYMVSCCLRSSSCSQCLPSHLRLQFFLSIAHIYEEQKISVLIMHVRSICQLILPYIQARLWGMAMSATA